MSRTDNFLTVERVKAYHRHKDEKGKARNNVKRKSALYALRQQITLQLNVIHIESRHRPVRSLMFRSVLTKNFVYFANGFMGTSTMSAETMALTAIINNKRYIFGCVIRKFKLPLECGSLLKPQVVVFNLTLRRLLAEKGRLKYEITHSDTTNEPEDEN
ncbi:CLUMA_CG007712, isoform A [Clunio marinus]|uniref:CLUMA_CG007712, isoform A n=1 Tax=Clunio marinus TaxID=568069 RepID=A0A1J1I3M3_9DIPT|nr:CLUMA_CG007712, isoform A [Clunio marinus]